MTSPFLWIAIAAVLILAFPADAWSYTAIAAIAYYVAGLVYYAGASSLVTSIVYGAVYVVVAGAVMVGASMAIQALTGGSAGDPRLQDYSSSSFAKGLLINKLGNTEPLPLVYGTRRVGGCKVFLESSGTSNEYLHLVIALCEGPISAIDTVYLNEIDSSDARFTGYVDVYKHLGATDQAADADLIAACPDSWTAAHTLSGVAYLYIRFKYDATVYASGLPTVTADIDAKMVYDPRDTLTKFSRNPALCIRDYLTNTTYGRGIPEAKIDDAALTVAANYCDEDVTVGGVTQDRYTCDGGVNVDDTTLANVSKLVTACRGMIVFSGGLYKLIIDKPEVATGFDFNEDNITGSWTISLGNKKNMFNRIRARFYNPARSWVEDVAVVDSAVLRALDNGLILEKTIEIPFSSDINTARQIATINLNQSRQQIACSFTAFISGLRCEVGDVVTITHTTPGWTAKEFRIISMALKGNDEVTVQAIEYDVTVYDFGVIAAADATPNTNLPDPSIALPPTGLGVVDTLYYTATGKGVQTRADVTWVAPLDTFIISYDVQFKLAADPDWIYAGNTKITSMTIYDLAAGLYDFRVRSVNAILVSSVWTTLNNKQLAGLTVVPADITGFVLRPLEGQAHLQWDRATDLDVLHGGFIKIRYANLQSGASWDGGIDVGPALAGSSTTAVLPLAPGTYMAKAIDSTGNYSANAVLAVTNVPSILAMNFIELMDEQADGFLGVKTDMTVNAGALELDSGHLTGSYEFATYLDLGGVYGARIWSDFAASSFERSDLIDDRVTTMDTWANFDGTPSEGVSAQLYIRTTEDDPGGAPVWTDWAPFLIADYKARAFEFKVEVVTDDLNYGMSITALSTTVDMADRTERASDVTVTVAGLSLIYAKPFHTAPAIGITMNDMATGDYYVLSAKSRTGFTINCYDSGDLSIERTIDWIAAGYGGEE